MLPSVEQNIPETGSDLSWRPERAAVIAICEDSTTPPKRPIDSLCQPDADALHPAAERPGAVRLDEQMHVVALKRIVHDPKGGGGGSSDAVAERWEQSCVAERGEAGNDPERHVNGMMVVVDWAWAVG